MKRLAAIICLVIFTLSMGLSVAFAASELKVEQVSPKDGAKDMAMDNMGFKVYFNENVYESQKKNKDLCSIVDNKGKKVPIIVVCNPKEKNVMMVLADTNNKKTSIKGKTKYTLKIEEGFKGDKGSILSKGYKASFTTLNPQTSMWVSMGMMVVMVAAMIFYSTREVKKQQEENQKKPKEKKVDPYKEAKRTGKSVEEIVAAEEKKKARQQAKRERQKKENKKELASDNIRVAKKAPISAVGLKYKEPRTQKKKQPPAQHSSQKKNQNKKKK